MIIISSKESGGVRVLFFEDASFVNLIRQIVMAIALDKQLYFFLFPRDLLYQELCKSVKTYKFKPEGNEVQSKITDRTRKVMYFTHCVAKWEWMYERLMKFLRLRFKRIEESWPYHALKK